MTRSSTTTTILLLACTALFLLLPRPSLADDALCALQTTVIAPDPALDSNPQIVIDQAGQLAVAWIRFGPVESLASLCIARPPLWEPIILSQYSLLPSDPLAITDVNGPWLIWSRTIGRNIFGQAVDITSNSVVAETHLPVTDTVAMRFDSQANLYTITRVQNALLCADHTKNITVSIPLTDSLSITSSQMIVGADGTVFVLLTERDSPTEEKAIYLASSSRPNTLLRLSDRGRAAQMAMTPNDELCLAWIEAGALFITHGNDLDQTTLLAQGLVEGDKFALSAGPTDAQVVWSLQGKLWHASSADWSLTTDLDTVLPLETDISLGIDSKATIHLAWTQETPEGDQDIVYATIPTIPQIQVCHPIQDEVIDRDSLIQAETNLPATTVEQIDFYLQRQPAANGDSGAWRYWGTDSARTDGWSIPLLLSDLGSTGPYRALAIATLDNGETVRHVGGWFRAQLPKHDPVWLIPSQEPAHTLAHFTALVQPYQGLQSYMDLYLLPFQCEAFATAAEFGKTSMASCPPPPNQLSATQYMGAFALPRTAQSQPIAQRVLFDSTTLPDGQYRAVVVSHDIHKAQYVSQETATFAIQNIFPPRVSITLHGQIMVDTITIEADASDLNGPVQSVDFWIEREHKLFFEPAQAQLPQRIWMGRDTDKDDGWRITRRIQETWNGGDWHLVAEATDSDGLSSESVTDGTVYLVAPDQPFLRFSRPNIRRILHGQESIIIHGYRGVDQIAEIKLYARDEGDRFTELGTLQQDLRDWSITWDTQQIVDGTYRLIALAELEDGGLLSIESKSIRIDNARPVIHWDMGDGQAKGLVPIRLRPESCTDTQVDTIEFQLMDSSGERHTIGRRQSDRPNWAILWNSQTVLDGTYELVARATTVWGVSEITRTLSVNNATPDIDFQEMPSGIWQGKREISWTTEHPSGKPTTTTISYSPDDGLHWLAVDKVRNDITGGSQSMTWDTTAFPDSPRARLRLVVTDGLQP